MRKSRIKDRKLFIFTIVLTKKKQPKQITPAVFLSSHKTISVAVASVAFVLDSFVELVSQLRLIQLQKST